MKNLFISFLIASSICATAQNESVEVLTKGTKFIGGDTYFYFNKGTAESGGQNSISKNSVFNIGPVAGKYIKENLAVGLGVGYGYSKNKNEYFDNSESESQGHSVNARFFLRRNYKIVSNLFFFLQASTALSFGFNKATNNLGNENKSNSYSLGFGGSPGLQIFLSKKLSLESSLGYVGYGFTRTDYKDSDSYYNQHQLNISGGVSSVNFSLRYFLD